MEPTKIKKELWEEIYAMPDYEEMKNNIKYINGILKKLDTKPVYPVTNSSIAIFAGDDRPINVIRLTRPQFSAISKHAARIEIKDYSWNYTLSHAQKSLWFSRLFVALEDLFGPSDDQGTDDGYKSSFYFPFLLEFPQEKENLGYLMVVRDLRCSVYYEFAKILPLDEYMDRSNMPSIFEDFTEDAIKYTVNSFYKYVESHFKSATARYFDSFFYKTIRCDLGVYGYKDGEFFDEGYDDLDAYEAAVRRLSSYKKR